VKSKMDLAIVISRSESGISFCRSATVGG